MSEIEKLTTKLRNENEIRDNEANKSLLSVREEYESIKKKIADLAAEHQRCEETIAKNLTFVTSHQHMIKKAANETTEPIHGLPISFENRQGTIDFVKDAIEFMNMFHYFEEREDVKPSELANDIKTSTEALAEDVKVLRNSVIQAETLYSNVNYMKNLCVTPENEHQELDKSIFDT